MRCNLTPIMAALLAVSLPVLYGPAVAAERGQIVVDDAGRGSHLTLDYGDTVTYTGEAEGAIEVSGAGSRVQGDGITVSAESIPTREGAKGVRVSGGGAVSLTNSTIGTIGDQQSANALHAADAGSVITLRDTDVRTAGRGAYGVRAIRGGSIVIDGGSIATVGSAADAVSAEGAGASISIANATLTTRGYSGIGVQAENGAAVRLEGVRVSTDHGYGISVSGSNTLVTLKNTVVATGSGADMEGAYLAGGRLDMDGGSLTGTTALMLAIPQQAGIAPSTAIVRNATLTATRDVVGYGVNLNGPGSSAALQNVSINSLGRLGTGVWLAGADTALSATVFDIKSAHVGIDNRGGSVTLVDGVIQTNGAGAHGLYASREVGTAATFDITRTELNTQGDSAAGVMLRLSGSSVVLRESRITTQGTNAEGLRALSPGTSIVATDSVVNTTGTNAAGVLIHNSAAATLNNTRVSSAGAGASGIWSFVNFTGKINTATIANGSQIDTQDGVALFASGAGQQATTGLHTFMASDAIITARTGGDAHRGVLLRSDIYSAAPDGTSAGIDTAEVKLNAVRSTLSGDVVAYRGTVGVTLADRSVLTGALVQLAASTVNGVALDASSIWNVRGDSVATTLSNAGTVAFMAPVNGTDFKTVTVNNYIGGGTLVINTRLGGDASATDKLVIDGGTATGNTALRVINAGGAGDLTGTGIRVVQTINGGTTAPDAFRLDAGSTGYRASAGTIALNGYDYNLVRGGDGGAAPDWYLTSTYTVPVPDPIDPAIPTDPTKPTALVRPLKPGFQNVSPESGAYAGNQLVSSQLFTHGLHDRVAAYGAASADTPAADGSMARTGRGLWTRIQGRQDSGLRMAEGRVDIATDSTVLQLGADLIKVPVGGNGALYAGLMGGYGDARTRSSSTLARADGTAVQARAHGKVTGYSLGLYGTAYQNDATRLGAYADTWLQLGRYRNQVTSELGSVRYHATVLSASLEAGYAVAPFAAGSVLGPIVLEPHAQLVYSRYDAQDATLQGTRMRAGDANSWNSRIGVRVYPQASPDAPAVRPFLEANWLRNFGTPSVQMGTRSLDTAPSHNSLELKLGAEGRVSRAVQVSGHVFGQAGSNHQRGYGGMFNAGYRW